LAQLPGPFRIKGSQLPIGGLVKRAIWAHGLRRQRFDLGISLSTGQRPTHQRALITLIL
jgi:hypothetical protein